MQKILRLLPLLLFLASPVWASPSGYVYVAVPAATCAQDSPCAPPQVVVFDGVSGAIVTTIPLPVHTRPAGRIAIAPDGSHLYVSNRGVEFSAANSLSIIDARHHVLEATVTVAVAGPLAVARDDSRVFILSGGLSTFDTSTRTIVGSAAVTGFDVAASSALDRVFVLDGGTTYAFDTVSLTPVGQQAHVNRSVMRASRDGLRLFDAGFFFPCTSCGGGNVTDAATLAITAAFRIFNDTVAPVERNAAQLVNFGAGQRYFIDANTGEGQQLTQVPGLGFVRDFALLSPGSRALVLQDDGPGNAHAHVSVAVVAVDTPAIVATTPLALPADTLASTPWGAASCSYHLDSAYASFSRFGAGPVFSTSIGIPVRMTTDCAWSSSTTASWLHLSLGGGTGNGVVTLTADTNNSQTRQATVTIGGQTVTVTQSGVNAPPPFGVVDTPADGATVSGAVAFTGWALDDGGVDYVEIARDPLPSEAQFLTRLGFATLVDGARPDVQAAYPTLPFASRAGWGYQLLTNALPGGDGVYRLHAFARNLDGRSILLGSRTITVRNAASAEPFGAIDTPGQGETVSGVITNWGWALTPRPANVPTDGSTVDVIIDNVAVGHPVYGIDRSDIAGLFPGYANTHSAVGYFTVDTTKLTNGVHTIAWVVRDSLGRAQGIGSRYFTVQNP